MCDPTLTGAGASQQEKQEWCAAKGNAEKERCVLGSSSPVTLGRILEGEWGLRMSCQPPVGLPMWAQLLVLNAEAISTTSTCAGLAWQGCPESAPGSWGSVTLWVPSRGNVTKYCQGRGGSWSTWKQKFYTQEMLMVTLWGSKSKCKACVDLWPSDSFMAVWQTWGHLRCNIIRQPCHSHKIQGSALNFDVSIQVSVTSPPRWTDPLRWSLLLQTSRASFCCPHISV